MFNKYDFLQEIKDDCHEYLEEQKPSNFREVEDGLHDIISREIERNVIYYWTCSLIVQELQLWSWEDSDSPIHNITDLAAKGLQDLVNKEIDLKEIYKEYEYTAEL